MHDKIKANLNKIKDLEERSVFKQVLTNVFLNLNNYTQKSLYAIEDRVYNELMINDAYTIYGTVSQRDEVDLSSSFFFPMIPEKMDVPLYNFDAIKNVLSQNKTIKLFEVFFDCGYIEFYNLLSSEREFTGIIYTNYNEYKATFTLEQNFDYISVTEDLYKLFSANAIDWRTINFPYIWRFVDVILSDVKLLGEEDKDLDGFAEQETITSISVDFEEYSDKVKYEMIPLWNIASYDYNLKSAPIPVDDMIHYEHIIDINDIERPGGVLVDFQNMEIPNIRRTDNEIIITLNSQKSDWVLYNIVPNTQLSIENFGMPIVTNERKNDFIQSFNSIKGKNIKTKAELTRLVNGFGDQNHIKFVDFDLVDFEVDDIGIYINYFIEDEIRDMASKKTMILKFQVKDRKYNFNEDIMNFLVTEVQGYFPEYRCVGELL